MQKSHGMIVFPGTIALNGWMSKKKRTKKRPEEMTSFPVKVKVCFQDECRIFQPTQSERLVYMLSIFKKLGKRLPKKRKMQWLFLVPLKGGRDYITAQKAIYKWYISGIYCQLGDYIIPTTF